MSRTQTSQSGFTLIELLLYVTIVSSLLIAITGFFGLVMDARVKSKTMADVDQQAAIAMDTILGTVRTATSITTPTAAGSGASLTLVTPRSSPAVFSLSSGALRMQEAAGAAVALTSPDVQVTGLTFKNLTRSGTNGMVQVTFTIDSSSSSVRNEYDYQRTYTGSAEVRL